ncbi:hypothetical protein Godav_027964 [Gossypium davidsonii]|uniref:RNase H type-1 domain-containing protein n=1 Tax=Gossypium davidsonii TaxID=34287 RepID=A0A7J8RXT1_GOSDV|nr:hypothetical protein [Gossypium davidsonii]
MIELFLINHGVILFNKGYKRIIIMTDNLEVAQILTDMDWKIQGSLCSEELFVSCIQKGNGG